MFDHFVGLALKGLIWMFCLHSLNNFLNHIHARALRLIYDEHAHLFQDVLEMTNEKTIHQKKKKKRMSGKGNLEISAQFISTHNELYFRSKR